MDSRIHITSVLHVPCKCITRFCMLVSIERQETVLINVNKETMEQDKQKGNECGLLIAILGLSINVESIVTTRMSRTVHDRRQKQDDINTQKTVPKTGQTNSSSHTERRSVLDVDHLFPSLYTLVGSLSSYSDKQRLQGG